MSGLPPGLLYLAIYNPSLKPTLTISKDDEDAEEQAHILFYTARQRAVSRDKMLRQVGLAKALVNFSSMFGPQTGCDTVHSQTRRMVMVSPEPDYWIHACVELAKTPRPNEKDLEKGKGKQPAEVLYHYHDGTLHDSALRAQILRGYEAFKISHGSFTSVMAARGKEALELQLERFFTVWAWSWDLETRTSFSDYLEGTPVHPLSTQLLPSIDALEPHIPPNVVPLVLAQPYIITSKSSQPQYPSSLPPHLLSLIPLPRQSTSRQGTIGSHSNGNKIKSGKSLPSSSSLPGDNGNATIKGNGSSTMGFLAMPTMNMKMDVRKWGWPGYLSFGMGGTGHGNKPPETDVSRGRPPDPRPQGVKADVDGYIGDIQEEKSRVNGPAPEGKSMAVEVDPRALEEALSSENTPSFAMQSGSIPPESRTSGALQPFSQRADDSMLPGSMMTTDNSPTIETQSRNAARSDKIVEALPDAPDPSASVSSPSAADPNTTVPPQTSSTSLSVTGQGDDPSETSSISTTSPSSIAESSEEPYALPQCPPRFSELFVHLPAADAVTTRRQKIRYLKQDGLLFALVPMNANDEDEPSTIHELEDLSQKVVELLTSLWTIIAAEEKTLAETFSTSSVKNVLQKSQYIISTPHDLTYTATSFSPSSGHFHDEQHILDADPEVLELFSRGQNPQDWHLAKRGLGLDENGSALDGNVYMQIGRKEATLSDVDNELAGVIRRFMESQ